MKSFYRLCTHGFLYALCAIALTISALSACGSTPESVSTQDANADLTASLDGPAHLPDGQSVKILFTVTNNSGDDLYLLTWYTPLEGIFGKIFRVTRNGIEIPYEGPLVMRGDPTPEDYLLIESGASVSAEVDLATVYDLGEAGVYTVQFVSPTISDVAKTRAEIATTVDDLGPVEIPCEPIQIEIRNEGGASATIEAGNRAAMTIRGTAVDVSSSAQIVTLAEVVDGVRIVALAEGCELMSTDGAEITLREVKPGMTIEATGRRGEAGALLASKMRILSEQRLHVFRDEFLDAQFMRTLTHQAYGGAELGECFQVASQIKNGDFARWTRAWHELARGVEALARAALEKGHPVSACRSWPLSKSIPSTG